MEISLRDIFAAIAVMLTMVLTACSDVAEPGNIEPELRLMEATAISRTEATITVEIGNPGGSRLDFVQFRYGDDNSMTVISDRFVSPSGKLELHLTGLRAGQDYFFCAEGGFDNSLVRSETLSFRTDPNIRPVIGEVRPLSTGSVGIILSFEIADDGGIPLTAAGCTVVDAATGFTMRHDADDLSLRELTFHISGLDRLREYRITPFAANREGETKGEEFVFITEDAVSLNVPGRLKELFADFSADMDTLRISGEMNGDDFRHLRRMLHAPASQNEAMLPGSVRNVVLSDVRIVAGGDSYDGNRFTENGKITKGMFADCAGLESVALPMTATDIEADAFRDCTALSELEIPAYAAAIAPSSGCTSLKRITVSEGNRIFKSVDGVLFDSGINTLIWFPDGAAGEYSAPPSVNSIGENAFRGSGITSITLPASTVSLGRAAFASSMLETVTLPDGITNIPYALFQNCIRLTEVRLGEGTNFIGDYAFSGDTALRHIYLPAVPPVVSAYSLPDKDSGLIDNCTLHVPAGRMAVYRQHPSWGKFKNIVEF